MAKKYRVGAGWDEKKFPSWCKEWKWRIMEAKWVRKGEEKCENVKWDVNGVREWMGWRMKERLKLLWNEFCFLCKKNVKSEFLIKLNLFFEIFKN